ncbi:hypothetical protein YTPLAS72_30210 [Nitrospira sp.]|nr:hypothetical protein YTPLAS72_30210 [Nitrospira sp.]
MSSIFISHSSRDNAIAQQVKAQLEQWGHRSVFLDFDPEKGIPAGRDWEKELYAKLRECRVVIVLCSHVSMASRWCFAEITHARALGKPVFPIKIDNVQVDRVLTNVQVIDAMVGWDVAYQRLEKGFLAVGLDPKDLFDWDGTRPPYPGLMAFQEQDAAVFFGRDKEIREAQALLNRLQQFGGSRLTLMLGASGSGKSSLMRAGLLPRLKRDQRWIVIDPFRPVNAPFDEFATVLSRRFGSAVQFRDRIRWDEQEAKQPADTFLQLIRELRENSGLRDATVLIMIDQCEELLASDANKEGNQFLAFLHAVLDREDSHLMVLATLRSDFLGSFQDDPAMRRLRVEPFVVPQMQVDDFASVIEGPAKIVGLELGSGLVQAMISDTKTSDALPLLAFTLRELWDGFGKHEKRLTLEQYRDKLGRLDGCIARAAEAVLSANRLSEAELSDLQDAFLSMVRVADNDQYAKQPVFWKELLSTTHSTRDVLEQFVSARLLVSDGGENGRTLEVAHEALFRAWPRLVGWLEDNKAFLVWQQRLNNQIKEWNKNRQSPDLLLRGLPLREALDWLRNKPDSFSSREHQFVTDSKMRMIRRRWVTATMGCLVLMVLGGPLAWLESEGVNLQYARSIAMVRMHLVPLTEPVMVPIPGGIYQQGDIHRLGPSNQQSLRQVTVKPFSIGKFEVTFLEYDRYVELTGGRLPNDESWGRDTRPIINVSWDDATAYAKWLSQATGKSYRLPTDSEWEYAARSGGKDIEWAGTSDEKQLAEYAVYNTHRTEPVGGRKPNDLGLFDMSGNVWEWVQDCIEVGKEKCGGRVIRGGSWVFLPESLSYLHQNWSVTNTRAGFIGFRLALDAP